MNRKYVGQDDKNVATLHAHLLTITKLKLYSSFSILIVTVQCGCVSCTDMVQISHHLPYSYTYFPRAVVQAGERWIVTRV